MTGHVELLCRIVHESNRGPMTDEQWANHWKLMHTVYRDAAAQLPEWRVLRDVKAALERLEIAGYVVVPSDPTEEMLHEAVASTAKVEEAPGGDFVEVEADIETCKSIWLEMLSARPKE